MCLSKLLLTYWRDMASSIHLYKSRWSYNLECFPVQRKANASLVGKLDHKDILQIILWHIFVSRQKVDSKNVFKILHKICKGLTKVEEFRLLFMAESLVIHRINCELYISNRHISVNNISIINYVSGNAS